MPTSEERTEAPAWSNTPGLPIASRVEPAERPDGCAAAVPCVQSDTTTVFPIQVPNAQFAYSSADSLATRSSVYRSSTVRRAAAANLWRASTFRISVSSC